METYINIYNQVTIQQDNRELTCWIPVDKRVTIGSKVKLKNGPDGWWKVTSIYHTRKSIDKINRDWPVGGL